MKNEKCVKKGPLYGAQCVSPSLRSYGGQANTDAPVVRRIGRIEKCAVSTKFRSVSFRGKLSIGNREFLQNLGVALAVTFVETDAI